MKRIHHRRIHIRRGRVIHNRTIKGHGLGSHNHHKDSNLEILKNNLKHLEIRRKKNYIKF